MAVGFEIETSPDAEYLHFNEVWDYQLQYPFLLNAQLEVTGRFNAAWGMVSDMRSWYVQTPTSERYCLKIIDWYYKRGLRCHAIVIENDPIVHWQFKEARRHHEGLSAAFFDNTVDAFAFLGSHGYSTKFVPEGIEQRWLNRDSEAFASVKKELQEDYSRFTQTL